MKRISLIIPVVVALLVAPLARAEGGSLSEAALDVIRTNCVNAQVNIQRIQQAEKPTRINRGYLYETTLKLMANFNSRVAVNKIDSPELLSITSDYEKQLKLFTEEYTKYDESLSALIILDCQQNPTKFHDDLVEARRLRNSLTATISTIDDLFNKYQTNIDLVKKVVGANV